MKTMDSGLWQGANRSNSDACCEDEQRRLGPEDTFHVPVFAKQTTRH